MLCESRGGRSGLPVPDSPYGLCGRKAASNTNRSFQRSGAVRVKVEVAVPSRRCNATLNSKDSMVRVHQTRKESSLASPCCLAGVQRFGGGSGVGHGGPSEGGGDGQGVSDGAGPAAQEACARCCTAHHPNHCWGMEPAAGTRQRMRMHLHLNE